LAVSFLGAHARKSPGPIQSAARSIGHLRPRRFCHDRAAAICGRYMGVSERHTWAVPEFALHFRNSCQDDHGLPGLIFRSCSDLIAGQIDGHAVAVIGRCKMQRYPVNDDPSIPNAEKTAEIDYGSPYLSPLIDQHIDNPAVTDLFAEHP